MDKPEYPNMRKRLVTLLCILKSVCCGYCFLAANGFIVIFIAHVFATYKVSDSADLSTKFHSLLVHLYDLRC